MLYARMAMSAALLYRQARWADDDAEMATPP